ncbi:MAG: YfiT family bacillithiol transferase [Gemmatimonadaceae bacterium]
MNTDLRYPIGRFSYPERTTAQAISAAIARIEEAPSALRAAVERLSPEQLDTPYRPGGWTVRQVIHHLPDSHVNAYVRTKLALTEDDPVIRPYDEQLWAALPDAASTPIETSLLLLENLHRRWVALLRSCDDGAFARQLRHPEIGSLTLGQLIIQYGWHGDHHVAHITTLLEREGW